jgi:Carboxypeptidase regulatory-like domain
MRPAVLFGALLLAGAVLWGQTGTVRIRVVDANGAAIPKANVSLSNNWNRTMRALSTDAAGEVLWRNLPIGEWSFSVGVSGFYPYRLPLSICDNHEKTIMARLQPAPEPRPEEQFLAEGPGWTVEAMPAAYCQMLDLPSPSQQTKPAKRK